MASVQVRDELEQLLHDDDDMAELFLTRKILGTSSPVPSFHAPTLTIASSLHRGAATSTPDDVDEMEMLLEVLWAVMLC